MWTNTHLRCYNLNVTYFNNNDKYTYFTYFILNIDSEVLPSGIYPTGRRDNTAF